MVCHCCYKIGDENRLVPFCGSFQCVRAEGKGGGSVFGWWCGSSSGGFVVVVVVAWWVVGFVLITSLAFSFDGFARGRVVSNQKRVVKNKSLIATALPWQAYL